MAFSGTIGIILLCLLSTQLHVVKGFEEEEPWRFITIADWHGAESFVLNPVLDEASLQKDARKYNTLKAIKQNYGGELVLLPGDSNTGRWYNTEFLEALDADTPEEAVLKAGRNCYQSMKYMFDKAGYSTLLMAVGDHEIGDNPWKKGTLRAKLLPEFRQIFSQEFNQDPAGSFLYTKPIGSATSRPLGTAFEDTSYAFRYKNVLFVTVDAFKTLSQDFLDKQRGLGGQGSVTGTVDGVHLDWFKDVLSEARKDPMIHHIIVQAHLPILQPVRSIDSSGMFMDNAEISPFFQAMQEYDVDVYFAGEVSQSKVSAVSRNLILTRFALIFNVNDAGACQHCNERSQDESCSSSIQGKLFQQLLDS